MISPQLKKKKKKMEQLPNYKKHSLKNIYIIIFIYFLIYWIA